MGQNMYSLSDRTAVTAVEELPTSDVQLIESMCKQVAQINPNPIIAMVADKEHLLGLSGMWEFLMDETDWDIMILRTRDDAEPG